LPTSLGPAEILVILVVALIVLGPKKLPEAGRQVGKAIAEVRKWSQGFQDEIKGAMEPEQKRPSYSEPQPYYEPPLPVLPAETEPPAATNGSDTNGSDTNGSVTTGSHGLVSGPPPAETRPADPDAPQP
jgi:Tat protein translocase TatB subunit